MIKQKRLSSTQLVKRLDDIIRDIFKLKYGPNPTCFVTGVKGGWFNPKTNKYGIQVGHYITRRHHSLRWDLKNVYPQSSSSNIIHNTNPAPFTLAILNKYGKERLDYLAKQDKVKLTYRDKIALLEKLTVYYKSLLDKQTVK